MRINTPIITIDGPSGSGKGAISKLLAEKIGWHYLDSGAVYRVFALIIIKNNIQINNISTFINKLIVELKITIEKENITEMIRREECGNMASKIAVIPEVRLAINRFLCEFIKPPGLVTDGRDMGTVVFPNAQLKIFLTASLEERASRRFLQLQGIGINDTLDVVLLGLKERDMRDENRAVSPLVPDPAAVIIDTTKISINETLELILGRVKNMHLIT